MHPFVPRSCVVSSAGQHYLVGASTCAWALNSGIIPPRQNAELMVHSPLTQKEKETKGLISPAAFYALEYQLTRARPTMSIPAATDKLDTGAFEQDENINTPPRDQSHKPIPQRPFLTAADRARRNINAKLSNPLAGFSHAQLRKQGRNFALTHEIGDEDDVRAFELGAVLAQSPDRYATVAGLTDSEKEILHREFEHRWSQPWTMYAVIALCSLSAAVQGMDETVVNGAQIFYKYSFGIAGDSSRDTWLVGLINSAPYLCCAVIGCWLTVPFNHWFGRRGTIFLTCCFSAITCLWQGFVSTYWAMFVARFALGFGIGPKSSTVPVYSAECAPPAIRGAVVMQWQVSTAFGIMLGYAADLIFYRVGSSSGLNWRLMMASAMMPALVVCCFVFFCPESPRWYMSQKQYYRAYQSLCTLRFHKVQAARDLYYMHTLLEAENGMKLGQNKLLELIAVPRNRRAMLASTIVMFMQQVSHDSLNGYDLAREVSPNMAVLP